MAVCFLIFTLEVLGLIAQSGNEKRRPVLLEHPADRGVPPFPSIWITSEVLAFERLAGTLRFLFHQCMYDAPFAEADLHRFQHLQDNISSTRPVCTCSTN